ncbi:hypothetical protein T492DRAFT_1022347 [Pavlovales sp. CCMP2436]|nr:hypothetical protein T492DRAFT_1022347 [Pavlovales sp. CCMP2436]
MQGLEVHAHLAPTPGGAEPAARMQFAVKFPSLNEAERQLSPSGQSRVPVIVRQQALYRILGALHAARGTCGGGGQARVGRRGPARGADSALTNISAYAAHLTAVLRRLKTSTGPAADLQSLRVTPTSAQPTLGRTRPRPPASQGAGGGPAAEQSVKRARPRAKPKGAEPLLLGSAARASGARAAAPGCPLRGACPICGEQAAENDVRLKRDLWHQACLDDKTCLDSLGYSCLRSHSLS